METISNIANSASKLIYGDPKEQSGQEPISGQSGRGTVDEPFDSGNLQGVPDMSGKSAAEAHSGTSNLTENPASNPIGSEALPDRTKNFGEGAGAQFPGGDDSKLTSSTGSNPLSSGSYSSNGPSATGSSGFTDTTTGNTGITEDATGRTGVANTTDAPGTTGVTDVTSTPGITGPNSSSDSTSGGPFSSSGTTGGLPSSDTTGITGTTGTSAAQGGAIRPEHDTAGTGVTSAHSNDPHGQDLRPTEASRADTSTAKAGGFGTAEPSVGSDPSSGAAPTYKQQGGDRPTEAPTSGEEVEGVRGKKEDAEEALLKKRDLNDHSGEPLKVHDGKGGATEEGSHPGQPGGGKEGGEKGTGEKVVKQSAFKADGGGFDASLPGAGREADRLLEQKGVHKGSDDVSPQRGSSVGDDENGGKSKPSMGTKIKEKLHIGSKHKE